jgi:class I lanthipeptide synthase
LLDPDGPPEWSAARAVFRRRSDANRAAADGLRRLAATGRLTTTMPNVVLSILHMFMNRLLLSAHRTQEVIVYDFLHRYLSGRLARSGRAGS